MSRIEGLAPIVLRENPKPGRTAPAVSGLFDEFGLFGSFSSSLCAVESKVSMSLEFLLVPIFPVPSHVESHLRLCPGGPNAVK